MSTLRTLIGIGCVVAALSACVSRAPAPVVDRRPVPAKPAPAPDTYVVKRGDTLYSIALDQGLDWREIAALNQLQDPAKVPAGMVLRLRPAAGAGIPPAPAAPEEAPVVVNPIAIVPEIEARPLSADAPPAGAGVLPPQSVPVPSAPGPSAVLPAAVPSGVKTEPKGMRLPYSEQNLALLQRGEKALPGPPPRVDAPVVVAPPRTDAPVVAAKPEVPPPAAKPEAPPPAATPGAEAGEDRVDWGWPAGGKVLAPFDGASSKGVDISGRIGDPIYASASGRVVYSGEGIPAYGKLVIIRHNNTYLSAYAHNNQILVREGQSVARGQKIAELGATGANQAKLHFEIRRLGKPVDPMQYLPHREN